jgi:hypothetical protein
MSILKAITGGLLAGLASLQAALPDGVTQSEALGVAIAALLGLGIVYAVPNRTTPPLPEGPQDDAP